MVKGITNNWKFDLKESINSSLPSVKQVNYTTLDSFTFKFFCQCLFYQHEIKSQKVSKQRFKYIHIRSIIHNKQSVINLNSMHLITFNLPLNTIIFLCVEMKKAWHVKHNVHVLQHC